ncbi:hypothetical protein [Paraprevotella xylaniphila]|uniref:hypothetical protein n=1 Tax=Paraprevotella xylaniphila TaxID=454155 RepID=UPI0026DB2853|nr:hypothetical protein [Paraprevotella xylaniphila]
MAQIGKRTSEYQSEDLLHGLFYRLFLRMANLLALIRPTRALRHPVPGKSQPAYSERLTIRQGAPPDPPK